MRVLHIITDLSAGGAQKLIEESVPLMNQFPYIHVDVLLLDDNKNVFDVKLRDIGIKVGIVPLRKPLSPLNIFHIRNYIKSGKYDIVHAHLFPTIYWVALASKSIVKNKPKFVMTEHNTHNRRRERGYLRFIEKMIYSCYHKIISISDKTKLNLIKWLKPKKNQLDKFVTIHNGIDVDKFKLASPYAKYTLHSNFTEETKLVCMVGSFTKQKDQGTLVRAFKSLPQNVHLLLVGEGEFRKEVESLSKQLLLDSRVHFLGVRYDIDRILRTVEIVVLSSNWEGFGLVAVEGMAAGKPVVVSEVPGLKEVVKGAGLLFPQGDSEKLAKILISLFENEVLYEEARRDCVQRAGNYDIKTMVKNYIKEYRLTVFERE